MGWQELARKKNRFNWLQCIQRINKVGEMIMVEKRAWLGCGQMQILHCSHCFGFVVLFFKSRGFYGIHEEKRGLIFRMHVKWELLGGGSGVRKPLEHTMVIQGSVYGARELQNHGENGSRELTHRSTMTYSNKSKMMLKAWVSPVNSSLRMS